MSTKPPALSRWIEGGRIRRPGKPGQYVQRGHVRRQPLAINKVEPLEDGEIHLRGREELSRRSAISKIRDRVCRIGFVGGAPDGLFHGRSPVKHLTEKFPRAARTFGREPDRVDGGVRLRGEIPLAVESHQGFVIEALLRLYAGTVSDFVVDDEDAQHREHCIVKFVRIEGISGGTIGVLRFGSSAAVPFCGGLNPAVILRPTPIRRTRVDAARHAFDRGAEIISSGLGDKLRSASAERTGQQFEIGILGGGHAKNFT